MEQKGCGVEDVCNMYKAHLLMMFVQLGFTLLYFITDASFKHGMSPHVYVTYRNIVAALAIFPFAYFLERKIRPPKLTLALFLEIFVLSLFGYGLSLNMYFASMKYTNPTFVTSICNTIGSITFVIAVALRLEGVNIGQARGIAKVVGTVISLGGAMIVTLYKGPLIPNLWPPLFHLHNSNSASNSIHHDWFKGSLLSVASSIAWAIWYIMQAMTLKRYPAQLSLTTWMCFVGAAQSAIFTVIVEHNRSAWVIGLNIDLWSTIYGGIMASGLLVYIQLWCTEQKGPVFVTMFNPLNAILVALVSYFVVGDKLYLGCIVGAIIVIIGVYLLLWGQAGDPRQDGDIKKDQFHDSFDHSECRV